MKFVANCLGDLYGGNPMEKARIDNWLDNSTQVLRPNLNNWLDFVFGRKPTCDKALKQAQTDVKKFMIVMEQTLRNSQFLCGSSLSIADIGIACDLVNGFRGLFDAKYRNPLKNVTRWFTELTSKDEFKQVLGNVKLCATALEAPKAPEPQKPKEEVKQAPVQQPKKKEEKPRNLLEELPPTSFVMDNWKGLYANEPDKKSIIQNFYDNYDPEGWSIWRIQYDKDEGEGQVLYMF